MTKRLDIVNTFKDTFRVKKLDKVILFATSACNLKCVHCFYWRSLNGTEDLRFEELEKISLKLPRFNHLLLSGGEPFLREELPDIIRLFHENNEITSVTIPTNGTLPEAIFDATERILAIASRLKVSVFVSLDGSAGMHNAIRGRSDSFERACAGMKALGLLKRRHRNLSVHINSVISGRNIDELRGLMDFVRRFEGGIVGMHYFDIVRGSPPDPSVLTMDSGRLEDLLEGSILPYQEEQARTLKRAGYGCLSPLMTRLEMSLVALRYKVQVENMFREKKWKVRCQAGISIIVIGSNGDVSPCESRPPLVNAREIDFDIGSFLNSEKMRQEQEQIRKIGCSCAHSCFIIESILKNPKFYFLLISALLSPKKLFATRSI